MKFIDDCKNFPHEVCGLFKFFWQAFDKSVDENIKKNIREMDEWDIICAIAKRRNCSEKDIFREALKEGRGIAHERIVDNTFDNCYVRGGTFPAYVKEYLDKEWKKELEKTGFAN